VTILSYSKISYRDLREGANGLHGGGIFRVTFPRPHIEPQKFRGWNKNSNSSSLAVSIRTQLLPASWDHNVTVQRLETFFLLLVGVSFIHTRLLCT